MPVPARLFVNQQGPLDALSTARSIDTYHRAQEPPPEAGIAAAIAHRGSSSKTSRPPLRGDATAGSCPYCGGRRHSRDHCPASNQRCSQCRRRGHFQKVCRDSCTAAHVEIFDEPFEYDLSSAFLGHVDADQTSQPYAEVLVNGHPIVFHVDTGADVSVISEKDYTAKAPR